MWVLPVSTVQLNSIHHGRMKPMIEASRLFRLSDWKLAAPIQSRGTSSRLWGTNRLAMPANAKVLNRAPEDLSWR